jgi:CDGSH-type Zn-finger protein
MANYVASMSEEPGPRIRVVPNGPYRVSGVGLVRMRPATNEDGDRIAWERGSAIDHPEVFDLCRCGASSSHPFCDGSEEAIGFDGTETAKRSPYLDRAFQMEAGPAVLTDDPSICSGAAFCEAFGTDVWSLGQDEGDDPESRELMFAMVRRCPSGRLAYFLPPGPDPVEEDLPQEIAVVDDGPYWVRGRIPVEAADGTTYEVRNRMTLCRCGQSRNKPFCDGSHKRVRFREPATEAATMQAP